jgi:ubiquinone/menaquinone biosynthesis C-methylase UbiE
MIEDPQEIVARGYDLAAERYARLEGPVEWPRMRWVRRLLERLPDGTSILDLGCGSGVPATRELARRHVVVGADISRRQIELARANVRGAVFLHADALELEFPPGSFGAVVALYLFDHVPRGRQTELLRRIYGWLQDGGCVLLTAEIDEEPGIVARWLDVPMYFSCFDAETTRGMVREAGFDILRDDMETQLEGDREVPYLWILAEKRGDTS